MSTRYPIDWDQAVRQAIALGGDTRVTIQTFADALTDRADEHRRKCLARVLHGDLLDTRFQARVQRLHDDGAGIFNTVNRTDGIGRKASNIVAVRAAIIDGDLKKPGVAETCAAFLRGSGLVPSLVVESSDGNFHYYFGLTDCTLEGYEAVQSMLHTRAGTDPLHDLPRVLRLAGAWHLKGVPFQSRIVELRGMVAYTVAELRRLAERVAPTTGKAPAAPPRNTTVVAGIAKSDQYEATKRLNALFDDHSGLVKPAVTELVRQIGAEGCGRHNAIVAIAGRLVFQRWNDERTTEFLVPIVNEAFHEGDWTKEVQDALAHARRRDTERLSTVRTATWP